MKRSGFTLIEMAIILVILGLILGIGMGTMIQFIKWNKRKETKNLLNSQVEQVIGTISSSKKIDLSQIPKVKDSYSQDIITIVAYKVTSNFLSPKNATVCDLKDTELTYKDNATGMTVNNVAFIVFSKGSDYTSDTYCNDVKVTNDIACNGTITTDSTKDLVRFVTLPELKNYLGCLGNPLKILNNELPSGIVGESYYAEVMAIGGIKPYKWCYSGLPPSGINITPNAVCPNYQESSILTLSGMPSNLTSASIKICVEDSNTPSSYKSCKDFIIVINSSGNGTSSSETGENNSNCASGYSFRFTAVNLGQNWIWVWPLRYSYNDREGVEEKIFLIPEGSTRNYSSPYTLYGRDFISVTFYWRGNEYVPLARNVSELDANGDCDIQVKCVIPYNYDGRDLTVVTCSSE
ncbi:hypothetical protein Dester_1444 [Desulfurobacterium thermolithotrophum DSM 11699]|uniref:Prepilin-type N-terminal cleavage/methylation domain-containing protein n=1 Tax=Desulfurobacterium thermolithotrophum (strain DSM 11699 / BSA) TaxID=868864 RepID=F0S1Z3_DESTD|nr:prepilin-type N-terminal cleavage/methylation domain-containing protein [Desulfurobacterium thermolithotrophum]ADY74074.1 hypothetical protein Dester_1444 [Desulfurobacterium thermolithotrophum DSM 11699]